MTPSPANNPATDDLLDSDGEPDGDGNSVAHVTLPDGDPNGDSSTDFGFTATSGFTNPGTGTPGYWKNHPEAWPVSSVIVGGVTYTKDAGDRDARQRQSARTRPTRCSALSCPAMLNVKIGNDNTCVVEAIDDAQRLDGEVRARRHGCRGLELCLEGRRAAPSADGQLQQRHALRATPRLADRCPVPMTHPSGSSGPFSPSTFPNPSVDARRLALRAYPSAARLT